MKLELKHLAGYLPYGLVFMYDSEPSEYLMLGLTKESIKLDEATEDLKPCWVGYNDYYKPVLRPLSDLDKKIYTGEGWFIPIQEIFHDYRKNLILRTSFVDGTLAELWLDYPNRQGEYVQESVFTTIDLFKLYEWHFDIHNLIEKDLAININDLNK